MRKSDSGAVLIVVVMLLVVLVSFASMVIDLTLFEDSREQSEYYARKAALAALNAHLLSTANNTLAKANEAISKAQEVTGQNFMLSDPAHAVSGQSSLSSGGGAVMTPGKYYITTQTCSPGDPTCDPDPCTTAGKTYPCFVPETSLSSTTDTNVTAYRVTGKLYSGVTTWLARSIFGVDKFPVDVNAISSVFPRQGCFLVDISGSMMQETNKAQSVSDQDTDPTAGHGRYYAFTTNQDNPTALAGYTFQDQFWNYLQNQAPDRPTNQTLWNTFLAPGNTTTVTEPQYQRMHFRNDYRFLKTLGDSDYPSLSTELKALHPDPNPNPPLPAGSITFSGGEPLWTRVDDYRAAPGQDATFPAYRYDGAEPLRTVFAGLNFAMNYFKQRRVAGDGACLIFYDSRVAWYRYVKMTNDFDYLLSLTEFDNANLVNDLPSVNVPNLLNDTSNPDTGLDLLVRHQMLPMGPSVESTNTQLALRAAINELQAGNPTGASASNFITLIGDGLSNCMKCPNPPPTGGCNAGEYECTNVFDTYNQTQNELLTWVNSTLLNRNIPVHVILVGQSVQPNTLAYADPSAPAGSGTCLTDKQARSLQGPLGTTPVPFVRGGYGHFSGTNYVSDHSSCRNACPAIGSTSTPSQTCLDCRGAFRDMSPDQPFLQANVIPYEIAAATKGLWGPIRKNPSPCNNITCTVSPLNSSGKQNSSNAPPVFQDPQCRNEQQQIEDYMEDIIGGNPISLVEVQ